MSENPEISDDGDAQDALTLAPSAAARNRLLPEGRVTGPMPWVLAIITFLTIIATAAGLTMAAAVWEIRNQLAGNFTVQIVSSDPDLRTSQIKASLDLLSREQGVSDVKRVADDELADQMRPWLGDNVANAGLPIPALIDARARDDAALRAVTLRLRSEVPQAHVEASANFLAPIKRVMQLFMWAAALVVILMLTATSAIVVLAARGAHETHRGTIDILHLLGATDTQIARLFQRRLALDAAFAGALGLASAAAVLVFAGRNLQSVGSELMQIVHFPLWMWAVLPLVPILTVVLSMICARITVRRALERTL